MPQVLTSAYRTEVENSASPAQLNTQDSKLNAVVADMWATLQQKKAELVANRGEGVSIRGSYHEREAKLNAAGFGGDAGNFYTPLGKVEFAEKGEYHAFDGMNPVAGTTGTVTVTLH